MASYENWINAVLAHETNDHVHEPEAVRAMAHIVTVANRRELALVLKLVEKLKTS